MYWSGNVWRVHAKSRLLVDGFNMQSCEGLMICHVTLLDPAIVAGRASRNGYVAWGFGR